MNGRMYDPQLGRMLSPDKFVKNGMATQDYNKYSYCNNNPLRYTDPSGYIINGGNWAANAQWDQENSQLQNGDATWMSGISSLNAFMLGANDPFGIFSSRRSGGGTGKFNLNDLNTVLAILFLPSFSASSSAGDPDGTKAVAAAYSKEIMKPVEINIPGSMLKITVEMSVTFLSTKDEAKITVNNKLISVNTELTDEWSLVTESDAGVYLAKEEGNTSYIKGISTEGYTYSIETMNEAGYMTSNTTYTISMENYVAEIVAYGTALGAASSSIYEGACGLWEEAYPLVYEGYIP